MWQSQGLRDDRIDIEVLLKNFVVIKWLINLSKVLNNAIIMSN